MRLRHDEDCTNRVSTGEEEKAFEGGLAMPDFRFLFGFVYC